MPYVDFRLFREDQEIATVKDALKVGVTRLMRINRNLTKYHSACEIVTLLKDLQAKYNSDSSEFMGEDQCFRTSKLVQDLIEYIKSEQFQHQSVTDGRASVFKRIVQTTSCGKDIQILLILRFYRDTS